MKRSKSNWVLAGAGGFFLFTVWLGRFMPENIWIEMLRSVAEAALIGGIADWFAVTALFEKPLGIPYHTALIPRNRTKIAQAISQWVEEDLLGISMIRRRLQKMALVSYVIRWADDGGKVWLEEKWQEYGATAWKSIDTERMSMLLLPVIRGGVRELSLAKVLAEFLQWGVSSGKVDKFCTTVLQMWESAVNREETYWRLEKELEKMRQDIADQTWKKSLIWFLEKVQVVSSADGARSLQKEIGHILRELQEENHPLRQWLRDRLFLWKEQLEQDEKMQQQVEAWKEKTCERFFSEKYLQSMIEEFGVVLSSYGEDRENSPDRERRRRLVLTAVGWSNRQMDHYWEMFKEDEAAQIWLEERLQDMVVRILRREHSMIGIAVEATLQRLTDKELNMFVRERAGNDLDWIRINGSLVGGAIGLVLFLILRFVYQPLIIQ